MDKFKQFNDSFGHPAGDEVLKTVSRRLEAATRNTDVVARYGGEEFVILLPYTGHDDALGLAERVRASIEEVEWDKRAITVSIGVGTAGDGVSSAEEFVSLTDEALYHSKLTGRNRVTHFDELPKKEGGTGFAPKPPGPTN